MSRATPQGGSYLPITSQVSCGSTIAQLFAASSISVSRQIVALTVPVYIAGSSTATSTNAHAVPANVPFTLPAFSRGPLWGVSTAATQVTTYSC